MTISTSHYVSVNIGSAANDGTGDDLRTAFNKVNQNFGNIETIGLPVGNLLAAGTVQASALTVTGGATVGQDLYVTGNVYASNIVSISYNYLTLNDPLVYLTSSNTYPYNYTIGFYSDYIGGPANTYVHSGFVRNYADNSWYLLSNVGEPAGGNLNVYDTNAIKDSLVLGNVYAAYTLNATGNVLASSFVGGGVNVSGNVSASRVDAGSVASAGVIYANSSATSTSLTTGALRVAGGAVFGGNTRATGYLFASGSGGAGTAGSAGVAPAYQYYVMNANLALPSGAGDVRMFNANVFLAASTTYEFEVAVSVYRNITTVTSTSLQFNLGPSVVTGAAGISWVNYTFTSGNASPNAVGGIVTGSNASGNVNFGWANATSNVALTVASTASAADIWATIKGTITTSTAGWISPTLAYTAAPGGVSYVQGGSYMKVAAVGIGAAGSATVGGNVAIGSWA